MRLGSIIGLIAAVITIFGFMTGVVSFRHLFSNSNEQTIEDNRLRNSSDDDLSLTVEQRSLFSRGKVYVTSINGNKWKLLEGSYKDVALSPGPGKKLVIAVRSDGMTILNIDGSNRREFDIRMGSMGNAYRDIKNIHFTSDRTIRFFIGLMYSESDLSLDSFALSGTGQYEITVDEYNILTKVQKIQ